jgi:hypothetical protein
LCIWREKLVDHDTVDNDVTFNGHRIYDIGTDSVLEVLNQRAVDVDLKVALLSPDPHLRKMYFFNFELLMGFNLVNYGQQTSA